MRRRHSDPGRARPDPAPFAIGHECVARVVEVGVGVASVAPGDLVVVPWAISCGTCERCRAGLTTRCASAPHMAMFGAPIGGSWGGLFSGLVRVPWADAMLVPLPAGLDPVAMASARSARPTRIARDNVRAHLPEALACPGWSPRT